jgi:hypothetical protein
LENDVPVSQSIIWRIQRGNYAERGLKAWTEDLVPQFITNNPFIAETYVRIAFAFICDCLNGQNTNPESSHSRNPVRILELGAGTGKFSFLFLRQLESLLRSRNLPLETVRYCMTDCSHSLLETWRTNRHLAEFAERNILQFEVLGDSQKISPRFLTSTAQSHEPLVVVANYFFDSLPQDAFSIADRQLFEFLQTTKKTSQDSGNPAQAALRDLQFSYTTIAVPENRYPKDSWNRILDSYRQHLSNATVLFPNHALETLETIRQSRTGPMLVLASDKGLVHENDLTLLQGSPSFEFHAPNVFSQTVNFHAIAEHFEALGGQALLPTKHSLNLSTCAFLLDHTTHTFPATKAEYQRALSHFGSDDLFTLLAWLNSHMDEMPVPQILALLRLSCWDPTTLMRVFDTLARQIRNAFFQRDDLRDAILRTWANHFPLIQGDNVFAFQCGVLLLELHFYQEAASMFEKSQDLLGGSSATSYNLGLCYSALRRKSEAVACMLEACRLDPAFEPAQRSLRKLQQE